MSYIKKAMFTAAFTALCVVLPIALHGIQNAGTVLLPMHIPVLLAGLTCGWQFGLLTGILGPLLSSLITGMPPAPILPAMLVELAAYGAVSGAVMQALRTGKIYGDLYVSLFAALILGRVIAGITRAVIFAPGSSSFSAWITMYFVTALPGLIIQIALLPAVVMALEKARLIPARYPERY